MKCIIVASFLLAVFHPILSEKVVDVFKEFSQVCQVENGGTDADLEVLESLLIPKTQKQSCMLACLFSKIGVMDNENSINVTAITQILDADSSRIFLGNDQNEAHKKYVNLEIECAKLLSPTMEWCDAAKTFLVCTMEGAKKLGII